MLIMLIAAFTSLGAAVLLGAALAVLNLRSEPGAPAPWPLAALHGLLGIAGFSCLVLALGGPPRGVDKGVASFGVISAALFTLALLTAGGILVSHRIKGRRAEALIGVHATFAVSGFVVLAAYLFMG
jgi:hypothetical protein